jgi:hypothetical protein
VYLVANELNEIIGHLNLVLRDFAILGTDLRAFQGDPVLRYRLLVRVFFHEYFRFREITRIGLDALRRWSVFSKEETASMREGLDAFFRPLVQVRNSLVHDSPDYTDKDHALLFVAAKSEELGYRGVAPSERLEHRLHQTWELLGGCRPRHSARSSGAHH